MSWKSVELSKLAVISIGRTPSRDNLKYWSGNHPWLSIADMNQGLILEKTKECISDLAIEECNMKLALEGTVLFSFKLSIGKIGIAQQALYHNEAIAALAIKSCVALDRTYFIYALKNINYLETADHAVKGMLLNKKKLADLKIPLPP